MERAALRSVLSLLLACVWLLSACAVKTRQVHVILPKPLPIAESGLPISVLIVLPESLRAQTHYEPFFCMRRRLYQLVPIGIAVEQYLPQALGQIFTSVRMLAAPPSQAAPSQLVMEVDAMELSTDARCGVTGPDIHEAKLVVHVVAKGPDGAVLLDNTFASERYRHGLLSEAVGAALLDVLQRITETTTVAPRVTAFARLTGAKATP